MRYTSDEVRGTAWVDRSKRCKARKFLLRVMILSALFSCDCDCGKHFWDFGGCTCFARCFQLAHPNFGPIFNQAVADSSVLVTASVDMSVCFWNLDGTRAGLIELKRWCHCVQCLCCSRCRVDVVPAHRNRVCYLIHPTQTGVPASEKTETGILR